jgi:ubiquinone/menaquinone biosynthesis C-methylase UbiE
MVRFPRRFLDSRERVPEAAGEVMADASEAVAYRGTAGKMWRWILKPFADRVLDQVPVGGRVLDLGTGPGLMPIYWASRRPDIEVVGVDLSPAMLELARAEAERVGVASRVRFVEADAADTGLAAGSFDVVACHYLLHHFDDPAAVLREMQRLTGTGGTVLVRDLVRPRPLVARLSTLFTATFLRNTRAQNRQYAESLAASFTAGELRSSFERAGLVGLEVRGGPVHVTVSQRPAAAKRDAPVFTHERAGRILAGAGLLASLFLAQLVSPWFLLAVAGTALNLVLSGITDRCAVKSLLIRMGLPGERDLGRAEAEANFARTRASLPESPSERPAAACKRLAGRLGVTVN